jgi:glutamate-ammonia-ligase adenylyltransferase
MKVRAVGGDAEFVQAVEKETRDIAFTMLPTPADLEQVESIRLKLVQESTPYNLKKAEGGLAELEFAVRLLQWRHASDAPEAKRADAMGAVQALEEAGCLPAADADALREAYSLYRRIENRIRIRHGRSETAHLPENPDERADLATRLGLEGDPLDLLNMHRERIHQIYRHSLENLREHIAQDA